MKIHDYLFYVDSGRWNDFLANYEQFGFKHEGGFAYPDYVYKPVTSNEVLRINISEPCVNVWDGDDKNGQREIWLWTDRKFGTGNKETVLRYIQDLVDAKYVKTT